MFTGIIEEVGKIKSITKGQKSAVIRIKAEKILQGITLGDSISVNGVCLTVTNFDKSGFCADVMHETLRKSSFCKLKTNDYVNLERAMSIYGRFGGHIVSGHIDGIGKISDIKKDDNAIWLKIETNSDVLKYIIKKGSIAIDGISLTVAIVENNNFSVSVIPHTLENTILINKNIGDIVNIENDCIGKYVEKILNYYDNDSINNYINIYKNEKSNNKIDVDFLGVNGFI